jgi:hypothetical protein
MIACSVCRHEEAEGELFCSQCGARLVPDWDPATSTAAFIDTGRLRESPAERAEAQARLQAGQVALAIEGGGQPVILQGRPEYVLGREGHEHLVPDLNLEPYGAREKGVSRVHAALRQDHQHLLVIDLGSTNGTRINGRALAAHQPARVVNGDEIRLGKLALRVHYLF